MTESRQSGDSSVEAGTRSGLGSTPAAPASHTSSGAVVSRASMIAATGMNDAIPLQTSSPSANCAHSVAHISSSTVYSP